LTDTPIAREVSLMKHAIIASSAIALAIIASAPAAAKNTADDWKWVSEYYATYGEWTVACEHRSDDEAAKRCYLRYVDVYSRDPFGALFVFITDTAVEGLRFVFEYEPFTVFRAPWTVVGADAEPGYTFSTSNCPRLGGECPIANDEAVALAAALRDGEALTFKFTTRTLTTFDLTWPSEGFGEALDDLAARSDERGL
ncbi:MAG: hypothetical protein AAFR13_07675, partial [Pseudomonadota bacterium]